MNFIRQNRLLLQRAFLPVLLITLIGSSLEYYTTQRLQEILRSPQGLHPSLYLFILLSLLTGLLFPLAASLFGFVALKNNLEDALVSQASLPQKKDSLATQVCGNFEQLCIETLRCWGSIITWGLFLFVPALVRYFQLQAVPLVVLLDPEYAAGKIDALKASRKFVHSHAFKILGLLFVFHLFLPLLLTVLFDQYTILWQTPVAAMILAAVETFLILYSMQILFNLYQSHRIPHAQESTHESHV